MAVRQAAIARAQAAVYSAESRLRALTNSPASCAAEPIEIVPVEQPLTQYVSLPIEDAKHTAMINRPEVAEAIDHIRAATVRCGMAKNQVLPSLGLVLEMYVSGLEGGFELGKSLGQQYSDGAPSYTGGITFEIPIGNRRARARLRQRQLELSQLDHRFQETVAMLTSEVEITTHHVESSYLELQAQAQAVIATTAEVRDLLERWRQLPGDDRSVSFLSDDLLGAQDRLMREEDRLADAERNYAVAFVELKRAMGTLVAGERIEYPPTAPPPPSPVPQPQPADDVTEGQGTGQKSQPLFGPPPPESSIALGHSTSAEGQ